MQIGVEMNCDKLFLMFSFVCQHNFFLRIHVSPAQNTACELVNVLHEARKLWDSEADERIYFRCEAEE